MDKGKIPNNRIKIKIKKVSQLTSINNSTKPFKPKGTGNSEKKKGYTRYISSLSQSVFFSCLIDYKL